MTKNEGRWDIVIFPNGGREIFARISSNSEVPTKKLINEINSFAALHTPPTSSKKLTCTWVYNEDDSIVVTWTAYNDNNPIVHVDKADLGIPYESDSNEELQDVSFNYQITETIPVELASLPANIAEKYNPNKGE